MDKLLNVRESAQVLGVTQACIRRWIFERRINVIRLGRLVRVSVTEVERILQDGLRTGSGHNDHKG